LKLTKKASQAFTFLRGNPDFQAVLEWIAENRDEAAGECCKHPLDRVQKAQGKWEGLQNILECNTQAPGVLEKFKSQR
jgi:hypothetical protein